MPLHDQQCEPDSAQQPWLGKVLAEVPGDLQTLHKHLLQGQKIVAVWLDRLLHILEAVAGAVAD